MASILALQATSASAHEGLELDCVKNGATLTWDDQGQAKTHVRLVKADGSTRWIATVNSPAMTYTTNDADATYIVRYRHDGDLIDSSCTAISVDLSCTNAAGVLQWDANDAAEQNIRKVEADGSTSWVATIPAGTTTFNGSPGVDYLVRVRVQGQPHDSPCSDIVAGPSFTCSVGWFGMNFDSFDLVAIDSDTPDLEYTIYVNGVRGATTSTSTDYPNFPNVYFSFAETPTPLRVLEVAWTGDLDTRVNCGSIGQDPTPVVACRAYLDQDAGDIRISVDDGFVQPFTVRADGVVVDATSWSSPDNPIPWLYPADAYILDGASLRDSIEVVNQDGTVIDCVGDADSLTCVHDAAILDWTENGLSPYNIRQIHPDGSTTWVATDFNPGYTLPAGLENGDFLLRYWPDGDHVGDPIDVICEKV